MEYEKCLVQVYEILNYLDEEELEKIPKRVIQNIEDKKDKSYVWKYDETKDLLAQEIDRKTVAILSYINLEYLLDEDERETLMNMHEANEERLFPKIGTVNFSKPTNYEESTKIEENNEKQSLVQINEQKWYIKIWKLLKQLFNR